MHSEELHTEQMNGGTKVADPSHVGAGLHSGQVLGPLRTQLEDLLDRYPHPVYQAAINAELQRVEQLEHHYDAKLASLRQGRISLTRLEDIRQTALEMFRKLAEHSLCHDDRRGRDATTYRGVSECTGRKYFKWPCIRTLGLAFDSAVGRVFGASGDGVPGILRIERLIIVPDRHWIEDGQRLHQRQRTYWRPIAAALDDLISKYPASSHLCTGGVSAKVWLLPMRVVRLSYVHRRSLDFALYGDIAVGIYTRAKKRERLTLWPGDSSEMRRCEAAWHLLSGSDESVTWQEMLVRLDLDCLSLEESGCWKSEA